MTDMIFSAKYHFPRDIRISQDFFRKIVNFIYFFLDRIAKYSTEQKSKYFTHWCSLFKECDEFELELQKELEDKDRREAKQWKKKAEKDKRRKCQEEKKDFAQNGEECWEETSNEASK